MKHRIICIAQVYNEVRRGNLERFVAHVLPLVDSLVVYDDASTDGSYEYLLRHTPHVIRGVRNDFSNEIQHKQVLLDHALKLRPDFILWLDADEVLTANAAEQLPKLCAYAAANRIDGVRFHQVNLWRSRSWRRLDSAYNDGWFVRLWRVTPGLSFGNPQQGLHRKQHPATIESIVSTEKIQVIHYGFASDKALAHKYLTYRSHGQTGWALSRLLDESELRLTKVERSLIPDGLWVDDDPPTKRSFTQALEVCEAYRDEVFKPAISVVCLIYKSVKWLDFVYDQLLRYTDMTNNEFFFVANDAAPEVLIHLRDRYIPHHVWTNTNEQRTEWYINNVYRAWNHAARVARGDLILFINSDMAFTQGWLDRLFEKLNGNNCVASRLVESGKLLSGEHGISKNFGRFVEDYDESTFLEYARAHSQDGVRDGGLFMPLLIRRDDFLRVGGYPEGNIVSGTDWRQPQIAKRNEPCVSGDVVLMEKLLRIGVRHQTAFDSMVYHFQCGEMDDDPTMTPTGKTPSVIVCNDRLRGSMGEQTMWTFLCKSLPSVVGVDQAVVGDGGSFSKKAAGYVKLNHPRAEVILQNATFMDLVDQERITIAYLQDNLRAMGRPSNQQERNLHEADILVTNSRFTALSYPEFQFEVIPIGVDSELFRPMDKATLRREFGFPSGQISIFVGDFTETKGWSRVRQLTEKRKDLFWILVSKGLEPYQPVHGRTYHRIPQPLLAKLLNCADFFIVGSPVETQCLAAIEACMCNVPVVMRNTGIFADFTSDERSWVGVFGDDFEKAVDEIFVRSFAPRQTMIERRLTVGDMLAHWRNVLERAHMCAATNRSKEQSTFRTRKRRLSRSEFNLFQVGIFNRRTISLRHLLVDFLRKTLPAPGYCHLRNMWHGIRNAVARHRNGTN